MDTPVVSVFGSLSVCIAGIGGSWVAHRISKDLLLWWGAFGAGGVKVVFIMPEQVGHGEDQGMVFRCFQFYGIACCFHRQFQVES